MTDNTGILADRIAVVTGGHSGIGRYISAALAAQNCKVAIIGRRAEVVTSAAEDLGENVFGFVGDISSPDSIKSVFQEIRRSLGPASILINNAAIFPIFKIADATDHELQSTININVLGVMYCIREAVQQMRGIGGDIISVSSESVLNPFPYLSVYAASKSAIETLHRGLKSELKADNIRVGLLRSGRVSVPDSDGQGWDPDRTAEFFEAAAKSGHLEESGPGIDPRTTAQTIVNMLTLPKGTTMDLVEVRGG